MQLKCIVEASTNSLSPFAAPTSSLGASTAAEKGSGVQFRGVGDTGTLSERSRKGRC
jgi:hypothetical protein